MEIVAVTKEFERVGVIENATIIWSSRYYKNGDFEIHCTANEKNLSLLEQAFYIVRDDDKDNACVIEDYQITSDTTKGDRIKIVGKFCAGYILNLRVVSQQTILNGNVQDQCRNLVDMNIINPIDPNRKIPFVKLGERDSSIIDKMENQITGANLQTKIEEICETKGIGYRMPLVKDTLYFQMYKGIDRSYAQKENPHVVFSDEYDNLKEASYSYKTSGFKNFAYVAGEGEGLARRIVEAFNGNVPIGVDRHEVWVDQRNMSTNDGEISEAEIVSQMQEEGIENLTSITTAFEGSVSLSGYEYGKGKDVYLGDIVTIKKTKWNKYINARIVEAIEAQDENGKTTILTFGI